MNSNSSLYARLKNQLGQTGDNATYNEVKIDTLEPSSVTFNTEVTTDRLYYVDFDNKYGDGAGTVYLKADVGPTGYELKTNGSSSTSKIETLNPGLYKDSEGKEIEPPNESYNNMQAVTWLLDTTKWNGLVESGANTEIGGKVNYVVGAPSLEMMMDSYNEHYGLMEQGTEPVSGPGDEAGKTRKKLFYKYTEGGNGYQVGPGRSSGYDHYTANYTVQKDDEIGSMYCPVDGSSYTCYWLASPSYRDSDSVRIVRGDDGGYESSSAYIYHNHLCPLVSLQSDVLLKLK